MRKLNIAIFCSLVFLCAACSKDSVPDALPAGSISLQYNPGKDTIELPVSILKDSTVTLGLKVALTGDVSSSDHWVNVGIDSNKIRDYKLKYGNAILLPATSYLFYKSRVRIAAGSSVSDSVILNLGLQTKLTEYTTYVLPVTIKSVDGMVEGAATDRVIYYVFKTGKPLFVNKTGWTIADFSSQNNTTNTPAMLLDANNTTTYWATSISLTMPQWVTINFNRDVVFNSLVYYLPTVLAYPNNGGYPTSMRIETSMNGTTWEDKGTFAGNIAGNMQTLTTGETTARYLRFTILSSVKYSNTYDAVFISGISLMP